MIKASVSRQPDKQYPDACSIPARKGTPSLLSGKQPQKLSMREIEVMRWLKLGKSNQEIARILGISACTVKNHLQRIFRKLLVFNRTHAVTMFSMGKQEISN